MTPLRLPPSTSDVLDRALGAGTADEVSAHLGELGEGECASCVVRGASCYLSVRWFARGKVRAEWWYVNRDRVGELVIGGPCGDPSSVESEEAREDEDLDADYNERHPTA